jgi:hypothetical protein
VFNFWFQISSRKSAAMEGRKFLGAEQTVMKRLKQSPTPLRQGTPQASAGENQIRRTQLRAKTGAAMAFNGGEKEEETTEGSLADQNNTASSGIGDKSWFSAPVRAELAGSGLGH